MLLSFLTGIFLSDFSTTTLGPFLVPRTYVTWSSPGFRCPGHITRNVSDHANFPIPLLLPPT
jgi:hypothetical protein